MTTRNGATELPNGIRVEIRSREELDGWMAEMGIGEDFLKSILTMHDFFNGVQICTDDLPTRIATLADVETNCNICLAAFREGDVMRTLPCQHEFHQECVDRWLLESKKTCPCCRLDVRAKKVASCCIVTKANLVAGRRVVRGPDWQWDDQDEGPGETGTLMGLCEETNDWASVTWANGRGNYRVSGAADLKYLKSDCVCGKNLALLSAKELKDILSSNGVNADNCIEKSDLVAKVKLLFEVTRVGARVQIHNMNRAVKYNGKAGTVRSILGGGRLGVEVAEVAGMISVKPENLRPYEEGAARG